MPANVQSKLGKEVSSLVATDYFWQRKVCWESQVGGSWQGTWNINALFGNLWGIIHNKDLFTGEMINTYFHELLNLKQQKMPYCHLKSSSFWVFLLPKLSLFCMFPLPKPDSFYVSCFLHPAHFAFPLLPVTTKARPRKQGFAKSDGFIKQDTQNYLNLGSGDNQNELDFKWKKACNSFLIELFFWFFSSVFRFYNCTKRAGDCNTFPLRYCPISIYYLTC